MDVRSRLTVLNMPPAEEAEKIVRKDCNSFLKTHKGLSYLHMKYPNLSILQAIDEYIKNALWVNYIV